MPDVIRTRRAALGLSQADLAEQVGLDKRQIRRYEAGEAQPVLSAARLIAQALDITLDELAGAHAMRVGLSGDWFASWETWKDGQPVFTAQPVTLRQRGDLIQINAEDRGNVSVDEGGYLWRGELRLWDNEILMGWYAAHDSGVRSLGTLFFRIHMHGQRMIGRWVGQSHDGPMLTGAAALAKSEAGATEQLRDTLAVGAAS